MFCLHTFFSKQNTGCSPWKCLVQAISLRSLAITNNEYVLQLNTFYNHVHNI